MAITPLQLPAQSSNSTKTLKMGSYCFSFSVASSDNTGPRNFPEAACFLRIKFPNLEVPSPPPVLTLLHMSQRYRCMTVASYVLRNYTRFLFSPHQWSFHRLAHFFPFLSLFPMNLESPFHPLCFLLKLSHNDINLFTPLVAFLFCLGFLRARLPPHPKATLRFL